MNFVDVLYVQDAGNEIPVGSGDGAPQVHEKGEGVKTVRPDQVIVEVAYPFADESQTHFRLFRPIGYSNAATDVDEFDPNAQSHFDVEPASSNIILAVSTKYCGLSSFDAIKVSRLIFFELKVSLWSHAY